MTDPDNRVSREVATANRSWMALSSDNHVFVAPLISFSAFIVLAVGDKHFIAGLTAFLLQFLLFQIAVTAHIRRKRLRRAVFVVSPLALLGVGALAGLIAAYGDPGTARALTATFSALLTLGVIVRIFGRVVQAPVIDVRAVANAITVYLMIGLLFSYVFLAIGAAASGPFFVQGEQPTTIYLYFSYITLATIGYGDYTAAGTVGKFAAVSEGLLGQLYLVTVLAVLVSNIGKARNPVETLETADEGIKPPPAPNS